MMIQLNIGFPEKNLTVEIRAANFFLLDVSHEPVCFFAMREYQTPDARKTTLQPAVNHTRNGTGK